MQVIQPISMIFAMPFSIPVSDRERQFFQFYCVQSAFDLSVYLNSTFWYNMILQYSQRYPVVRQAVIAFGASHTYAININSSTGPSDQVEHGYEQAKQYDRAIRWLRAYMETSKQPDPQVILICCALFFCSENSRGNREAALQHLEKGLSIINAEQRNKLPRKVYEIETDAHTADDLGSEVTEESTVTPKTSEIDEELLYVFSRLDCQATLCQDTREPVLDLDDLTHIDDLNHTTEDSFRTITDAQRSLDALHNRLARFLTKSAPHRQDSADSLPHSIVGQKRTLHTQCARWEELMKGLIAKQSPSVQQTLKNKQIMHTRKDFDTQLAVQIQLLTLHHRCWWMLFRSSYPQNPVVFTMSPNPRAAEILDICESLGSALPVRPSASPQMNDADMAWRLISEIGVAAPLFVLSTKCTDKSIQTRSRRQLEVLREQRSGIYDKMFLTRVIKIAEMQQDLFLDNLDRETSIDAGADHTFRSQQSSPADAFLPSPNLISESEFSQTSPTTTEESVLVEEARELLGWGRKSSIS